jgi:hypothetical protein
MHRLRECVGALLRAVLPRPDASVLLEIPAQ